MFNFKSDSKNDQKFWNISFNLKQIIINQEEPLLISNNNINFESNNKSAIYINRF